MKARVIDELQLRSALARHAQWGGRLSRIVSDMGLAREDAICDAICQALNLPRVQLGTARDVAAMAKVDVTFAEEKGVFPVALRDGGKTLVLAMADPTDLTTLDQVAARSGVRVQPVVASDREIENAILRHYRNADPLVAQRAPALQPEVSGESEEFKITDMSGKTVIRRLADVAPQALKAPPAPSGRLSKAAALLDEMLSGGAPAKLTPEEIQRLRVVQANQEKSSKILRALIELLTERGVVAQTELTQKTRA